MPILEPVTESGNSAQTMAAFDLLNARHKFSNAYMNYNSHIKMNHNVLFDLFIYLFGVLRRFQHCTGHITTGSWKG